MGPQEVRLGPVEVRWVQICSRRTASLVKVSDWPALASNKPPVPGNPKNITLMIVAYFIIWQCLLALLFQALCWDMAVNEVGGACPLGASLLARWRVQAVNKKTKTFLKSYIVMHTEEDMDGLLRRGVEGAQSPPWPGSFRRGSSITVNIRCLTILGK